MTEETKKQGLYVLLLSVHGLVRGHDIELGRDPDTGGQVLYVVNLARALSEHPAIERVDLLTRQIFDRNVDDSYQQSIEPLNEKANIVRLPCGPRRYLRKESLWPYLDSFGDHALYHFRMVGRCPDIIHGHYADAGYVGSQLARLIRVPFVFTGHSLGRVKQQLLLQSEPRAGVLEQRYQFTDRIEAEETALDTAGIVIASTHQEVEEQYQLYDHYEPQRMKVIPPGIELDRFYPGNPGTDTYPIATQVDRFLRDPDKPIILAIARPDEKKNLARLVEAFAIGEGLRERANLVIVAGNRDSINSLPPGQRRVLSDLLFLIDEYDLYGSVAYPKHHGPDDVGDLYRLTAARRGVFVNPAITEPFGLTLIEAAACGLPFVATNDGGPRDIVAACECGELIDPLDPGDIARTIIRTLEDQEAWQRKARNAAERARANYSWATHVQRYYDSIQILIPRDQLDLLATPQHRRLTWIDRILVTDIDNTLTGDPQGLDALLRRLEEAGRNVGFALASGRIPESARAAVVELDLPQPDILIASVGTEIFYGEEMLEDRSWRQQINYLWRPDSVRDVLGEIDGLTIQDDDQQREFKISYDLDPDAGLTQTDIVRQLRHKNLRAKVIFSHQVYVDIIPIRASAGLALRYLTFKWGIPPERLLVAGDAGNDEEMLSGNTLGVVVGNYSPELEHLRGRPRIYFAEAEHAWGILEGMDYYNFLGEVQIPEESETPV